MVAVPTSTNNVSLELSDKLMKDQKVEYNEAEKNIEWNIKWFNGQKQLSCVAIITLKDELNSYQIRKEVGPVKLSFEINNYMASSLFVKYLRAEGNYDTKKPPNRWLRYITTSNSYIKRI